MIRFVCFLCSCWWRRGVSCSEIEGAEDIDFSLSFEVFYGRSTWSNLLFFFSFIFWDRCLYVFFAWHFFAVLFSISNFVKLLCLQPAKLYKLKHLSKVEEFCAYMSNASGSELKIWRARENSKDVLQGTYEKGQKFWKKFRILLCCMPLNSKGKDFVNAKNKQLQGIYILPFFIPFLEFIHVSCFN